MSENPVEVETCVSENKVYINKIQLIDALSIPDDELVGISKAEIGSLRWFLRQLTSFREPPDSSFDGASEYDGDQIMDGHLEEFGTNNRIYFHLTKNKGLFLSIEDLLDLLKRKEIEIKAFDVKPFPMWKKVSRTFDFIRGILNQFIEATKEKMDGQEGNEWTFPEL